MSSVYLELMELGSYRIREIEDKYLKLKNDRNSHYLLEEEIRVLYDLSRDTAIMIAGGADHHECSQMIYKREELYD